VFLDGLGNFSSPNRIDPKAHHASHETGGPDAIAALAGEVITTGTVADARLSSNVPLKNSANTFTQPQTISLGTPRLVFRESPAPPNQGRMQIETGGLMKFQALDDTGTILTTPLTLNRDGSSLLQGPVTANGDITISKTVPRFGLNNTALAVDARLWRQYVDGAGNLAVSALNDAASVVQATPLTLARTGNVAIGGTTTSHTGSLSERGRLVAMGEWQDLAFNAANFTAGGGGTWTVNAAALLYNRYTLIGKTLHWRLYVAWFGGISTVAGTVTELRIAAPPGLTFNASGQTQRLTYGIEGGSVFTEGLVAPTSGYVALSKLAGTNWSAGTAGVVLMLTLEIS
jgi:hypothetical protein